MQVIPLTPMQLRNVNVLIEVLTGVPDSDYNHAVYGTQNSMDDENENAMCAIGHALRNRNKFRAKLNNRTIFHRLLGIETRRPIHVDGRFFAREVFGDDLFYLVFNYDAFHGAGFTAKEVTKNMVLERLCNVRHFKGIPQ